jgi:hypothetical protein
MRRTVRSWSALAPLLLCVAAAAPLVSANENAPPGEASAGLPASLPLLRDAPPADDTTGWRPAWLLLSLAGGAGGWWLWRRLGGRASVPRSRVRDAGQAVVRLSSQPLTPQASVHVVQWRGEEFLIACTGQQVSLLSRIPVASRQEAP